MNWKKVFGILVSIVVLGFLFNILYQNWNQLQDYEWQFNFVWLLLSFLALSISPFLLTGEWLVMLKPFGHKPSFWKVFNVINLSNMVRYIPGNIWYIAGRIGMFRKYGISGITSSISIFVEVAMSSIAAFLVFLVALLLGYDLVDFSLVWLIIVIVGAGIVLHPFLFNKIVKKVFKFLKKKDIEVDWNSKTIIGVFLFLVVHWIVQGFAFYFLVQSIYPVSTELLVPFIGIYAIAWVISFLTFISPAGLGVKEGILVLLLQNIIPLDIAIIVSILSRILTVIQEALFALLSILLRRSE